MIRRKLGIHAKYVIHVYLLAMYRYVDIDAMHINYIVLVTRCPVLSYSRLNSVMSFLF